jgi:RNA polymerase sigma-70 factor (sigma-E family)
MARTEGPWGTTDAPPSARAAVTDLFHHHYRRLVGLAGLMVDDRETAEEVVQDAFEALYRNWARLRDPYAAVAYLNRSVVNGSRSKVRRRMTERAYELPDAGAAPSAETVGLDGSRRNELIAAVRELPRRQREVMVLRYFLDLSEEQIAEWLGVSKGSVKRHAFRATDALQKRMEAWA